MSQWSRDDVFDSNRPWDASEAARDTPRKGPSPGKVALTTRIPGAVQRRARPVQKAGPTGMTTDPAQVQSIAAEGVAGGGGSLPHMDRIADSFGAHAGHLDSIEAHVGGKAGAAADAIGANAYATGNSVAFGQQPDLHTAAHEAAHVVQQRAGVQLKGGVGEAGDRYEQNADAVADRVVRGESAEDLLDSVAPTGPGANAGGVQRQVQLDIKEDLREAMDGWGTDEDAITSRLARATPEELQAVVQDNALMAEIRDELSGDDLRQVLRRLGSLEHQLRFAIEGWGTDEQFIWDSIANGEISQVEALAANTAFMAEIDDDLNAQEQARLRATMARRVQPTNPDLALTLLISDDAAAQTARLTAFGSVETQRTLFDTIIMNSAVSNNVIKAFQLYWQVETTVVNGATTWPAATVKAIHIQMKALPDRDTRAGVWNELQLTGAANLINRAAWNGSALIVGANASTGSTTTYGYATQLTAAAASGATTLEVQEGNRFAANDELGVGTGANRDTFKVTNIAGNTYTIDTALAHGHAVGERVTPNDGSARRDINWLDATVRHEIAHAVETALGGVTGFTVDIGGWWTGTSFDTWAAEMSDPWATNDGSTISDADKAQIKTTITNAMTNRSGSLFALGLDAAHPIEVNKNKAVPVITAAETCLSRGDGFYRSPEAIYASNGKRFSISWWYKKFMYHNEAVVSQRLKDYQLYAPAEFFAEAYTVFYEEAGQPGITDADYGRLIRNSTWRSWVRTNIHERGQAPAGTGAAPTSPSGEDTGARPSGAGFGKSSGNPGP